MHKWQGVKRKAIYGLYIKVLMGCTCTINKLVGPLCKQLRNTKLIQPKPCCINRVYAFLQTVVIMRACCNYLMHEMTLAGRQGSQLCTTAKLLLT